jgi:hypothetical protein
MLQTEAIDCSIHQQLAYYRLKPVALQHDHFEGLLRQQHSMCVVVGHLLMRATLPFAAAMLGKADDTRNQHLGARSAPQ